MNFIIGANGRLGNAIAKHLPPELVTKLDRSVYADWWQDNSVNKVYNFFNIITKPNDFIFIAAGVIDTKLSAHEHHQINFLLAKNIIEGVSNLGLRVVTFGTVMEDIIAKDTTHPYFASKIKLGNFVSQFASAKNLALHIRIHTLFGGHPPHSFMFMGELYHSLIHQIPFKMSSGEQLREYHHIDDEIEAIFQLINKREHGIVDLSHGAPLTLKNLATYIFNEFNCLHLLNIGKLPNLKSDNYAYFFKKTEGLENCYFRDTLPAIVEFLKFCHVSSGGLHGI